METYEQVAAVANSSDFQQRLQACCGEQALLFVNDGRPEYVVLAEAIIGDSAVALSMRWIVASAPVAGDIAEDPVLLAAVQYAWPLYGATLLPEAT